METEIQGSNFPARGKGGNRLATSRGKPQVMVNAWIPEELKRLLQERAERLETSQGAIVRMALKNFLQPIIRRKGAAK